MNAVVKIEKPSLIQAMANAANMDPIKFAQTIKSTCIKGNCSDEDFAAFLMVAHQHNLNPVTREIYAFPKQGGGIQPIVSIDGWMKLINDHPNADGMEFEDKFDDKGNLEAIECSIFRKDRTRPVKVTEYMEECKRKTEPWTKWPARMLRHKAAIQCARYAFSFSGIIDQDEADRSPEVITEGVVAPPPPTIERHDNVQEVFDASELLAQAEDRFDECNTANELEDAFENFSGLTDTMPEADIDVLNGLYEAKKSTLTEAAE